MKRTFEYRHEKFCWAWPMLSGLLIVSGCLFSYLYIKDNPLSNFTGFFIPLVFIFIAGQILLSYRMKLQCSGIGSKRTIEVLEETQQLNLIEGDRMRTLTSMNINNIEVIRHKWNGNPLFSDLEFLKINLSGEFLKINLSGEPPLIIPARLAGEKDVLPALSHVPVKTSKRFITRIK